MKIANSEPRFTSMDEALQLRALTSSIERWWLVYLKHDS